MGRNQSYLHNRRWGKHHFPANIQKLKLAKFAKRSTMYEKKESRKGKLESYETASRHSTQAIKAILYYKYQELLDDQGWDALESTVTANHPAEMARMILNTLQSRLEMKNKRNQ
jgi:hypothetical protein